MMQPFEWLVVFFFVACVVLGALVIALVWRTRRLLRTVSRCAECAGLMHWLDYATLDAWLAGGGTKAADDQWWWCCTTTSPGGWHFHLSCAIPVHGSDAWDHFLIMLTTQGLDWDATVRDGLWIGDRGLCGIHGGSVTVHPQRLRHDGTYVDARGQAVPQSVVGRPGCTMATMVPLPCWPHTLSMLRTPPDEGMWLLDPTHP